MREDTRKKRSVKELRNLTKRESSKIGKNLQKERDAKSSFQNPSGIFTRILFCEKIVKLNGEEKCEGKTFCLRERF